MNTFAGAYLLLIHDWRTDSIHEATDRRVTWVVEIEIGYVVGAVCCPSIFYLVTYWMDLNGGLGEPSAPWMSSLGIVILLLNKGRFCSCERIVWLILLT